MAILGCQGEYNWNLLRKQSQPKELGIPVRGFWLNAPFEIGRPTLNKNKWRSEEDSP